MRPDLGKLFIRIDEYLMNRDGNDTFSGSSAVIYLHPQHDASGIDLQLNVGTGPAAT
jgi:hypothetical protein